MGDNSHIIFGENVGNTTNVSTITLENNMIISLCDSITDDQRKFLKDAKKDQEETGLEVETTLADLDPSKPTDIIEMQMVINSICMISKRTGNGGATGFLANDPDLGIIFFSAGHVFEDIMGSGDVEKLDNYMIHFANLKGNITTRRDVVRPPTKGKPMSLKDFLCKFNFHGSMSHKGRRKIYKKTNQSWIVIHEKNSDFEEDYVALRLNHTDLVGELAKLGLEQLQCGVGKYLDYREKGLVTIAGHPGGGARKPLSDGTEVKPLRYSFGKEKPIIPPKLITPKYRKRCENYLYFDYDSLGGNSGSPIIARGYKDPTPNTDDQAYKVKAIHKGKASMFTTPPTNRAQNKPPTNRAQKITKLATWIGYGT